MTPRITSWAGGCLLALACAGATASGADVPPATPRALAAVDPVPAMRNGREIYARFREGLADPDCDDASQRWQRHFANAPTQLASRDSNVLPLFGYVVDTLREANLPTEYALIPFVESGYKPGARSGSGAAGLWQFIALTARNHQVPIRPGYDGRLSPVDSTQAAVRYLKTLHGMFAGDWRLTVMAYNAGEYRLFDALKRSGQRAADAQPEKLVGLSGITQAYVRKLHALSCVLDHADDREEWMRQIDRPVPRLSPMTLPGGTATLDAWAAQQGIDAAALKRLNPAFPEGRVVGGGRELRVLAPQAATAVAAASPPTATVTMADASDIDDGAGTGKPPTPARRHTVARGDSVWRIAQRYGISREQLLARNGLTARSVLQPGMVLEIDGDSP
jgi:membrane-bound lytic murein transglycosylase D